jgi:hypothetical protein
MATLVSEPIATMVLTADRTCFTLPRGIWSTSADLLTLMSMDTCPLVFRILATREVVTLEKVC